MKEGFQIGQNNICISKDKSFQVTHSLGNRRVKESILHFFFLFLFSSFPFPSSLPLSFLLFFLSKKGEIVILNIDEKGFVERKMLKSRLEWDNWWTEDFEDPQENRILMVKESIQIRERPSSPLHWDVLSGGQDGCRAAHFWEWGVGEGGRPCGEERPRLQEQGALCKN